MPSHLHLIIWAENELKLSDILRPDFIRQKLEYIHNFLTHGVGITNPDQQQFEFINDYQK